MSHYLKFSTTVEADGTVTTNRSKAAVIGATRRGADMDWEKERLTRLALRPGSTINEVIQTENTVVVVNAGGNVTTYHWIAAE